MEKKPFKTDIAVALIFFNRPDTLKRVFKAVQEARPSKLYLIQDGPRENRPSDLHNILLCRDIVNNVDWNCEVHYDYSDNNLGCGRRVFTGLNKVFEDEEYAAIIEDDIVIGDSFLPFCKELCELYRNDERIQMISGMNHLGEYRECTSDYFFSQFGGAIWGWATWRRCWKELDWNLDIITDSYVQLCLKHSLMPNNRGEKLLKRALRVRDGIMNGTQPSFWTLHYGLYGAIANRLNIVPKINLISNIGLSSDSTHAASSLNKMVRRIRVVFFTPIHSFSFPLKHPKCVIDDQYYMSLQDRIMNPSKWVKFFEMFERIYIKLFVK